MFVLKPILTWFNDRFGRSDDRNIVGRCESGVAYESLRRTSPGHFCAQSPATGAAAAGATNGLHAGSSTCNNDL